MSKYSTPKSKGYRAHRGEIIEEWQTHCGFKEPKGYLSGILIRTNEACDAFFALRDMVWVASACDYLPSEQAFHATAALAQNR